METTSTRRRPNGAHRRLKVWQVSMDLVEEIYRLTAEFPRAERFGLTSQMRRAAVSIPSNIAEGNERRTAPDKERLIVTARGSVAELSTQLEIAIRVGFAKLERTEQAFELIDHVARMLARLAETIVV